jgi:hypothetical protein
MKGVAVGISVETYAERRRNDCWEPIIETDTGTFDCYENSRMLARFLGSVEGELHSGFPNDLSDELRSLLGKTDERCVSWTSGVELREWKRKRIGRRKYSAYISGFVERAIPSLLEHGDAHDVRIVFVFNP